jgi:membrane protein
LKKKILKLVEEVKSHPLVKQLSAWFIRFSLPGFEGVPFYTIVSFIIKELKRDAITTRANSIAFDLFLALFPAIIFIFTLIPLMPFSEYYTNIIDNTLKNALPSNASEYFLSIIQGITKQKRGGLLSLGFVLSALFSSNGMVTLMYGFDKSYDKIFKKRSYLKLRIVALFLTLLLILIFTFSVIFVVVGDEILSFLLSLLNIQTAEFLFNGLRIVLALFVIYSGITVIYRYGPSMYKRINFISPGAILATVLSIGTSLAFAFFVDHFGKYNEIYGSIGALIVIMIWLQLNAFILLIGFELNASIAVHRDLLEVREDD